MEKAKRKLVLDGIVLFCAVIVVATSALSMAGVQSRAQLIGVIAGSFGMGAALVNLIRDYSTQRQKGK